MQGQAGLMRVLLDTHVFLWWITNDSQLSADAISIIGNAENEVVFSAVSAWEISILVQLERIVLASSITEVVPAQLEQNGFAALPVTVNHALRVGSLPTLHRDPFDRMLIAQAQIEELTLITADEIVTKYPVSYIWARA